MKVSFHKLVLYFVAALFIACGCVTVQAQTDAVIAQAKKEGRVSYYGTQDMAAANAMIRSFQETYPFIKVDLFRQGTTGLMTRVLAEAQAGKHGFDVISLGIMEIQLLKKKELVARYLSPEAKEFAPGLKDKDGFWTAMSVLQFVIGYNTSMMSGKKIPRDWRDLLNPIWKGGQIGAERDGTVWYASMLQYWGREKGVRFMKQLSAQQPHLERGNTLRTQMMAAGEFPMAIVHAHKVEQFKAKGAPLDWVTAADPIVTQPFVLATARHARNPNAARLFLDFVLSKKGQLVIKENGSMPARPDMTPIAPSLDQSKLKVHYVDPALAENYNQYAREYQEIF
jgi:iron(III) transport system substrate-binding protein